MKRTALLLMIISLLSLDAGAAPKRQAAESDKRYETLSQQIKLFGDVYREVNKNYVEEIDAHAFIKAGIDGMLSTLDPYTVFFEPDETDDLEILTTGQYGGVGIEIGLRGKDRELTVISPIEDTPAMRKGIRAGDVIIMIDGKSTKGFTTSDAAKHIRGPEGTDVTLTIKRTGFDQPLDYVLTRENIKMHDVAYAGMLEGEIGYIKLVRFSNNAPNEMNSALQRLMKQKPSGLILDLRSNPGGLLPSAVEISQLFLFAGDPIVSTKRRQSRNEREFRAVRKGPAAEVPLVVLVNGGSASASEIVSGAIQDLDRGVIIGTPTFGKGLVQSVVKLNDGAALKITTARYYTPSGRCIQKDRSPKEEELVAMAGVDLEEVIPVDTVITDTLSASFQTRSGRPVFGSGGVNPDLIVEPETPDPVGVEMYRRDLFFSFVRDWLAENPDIDTVNVSIKMKQAFTEFVENAEFVYPNPGDGSLKELTKIGEREKLSDEYFQMLETLRKQLARSVKVNEAVEAFILQSLDREMASALGGREWRIRSTFDEDKVLKEAVRVLNEPGQYAKLLKPPANSDIQTARP